MKTFFEIDVFKFNDKVFTHSKIKNLLLTQLLKQETSAQNNLLHEDFKYSFKTTQIKLTANLLRIHPNDEKNDHFLVFHDRFQYSDRFFQPNVQQRLIESEGVLIIDSHGNVSFKPDRSFLIKRGETIREYSLIEKKQENIPEFKLNVIQPG